VVIIITGDDNGIFHKNRWFKIALYKPFAPVEAVVFPVEPVEAVVRKFTSDGNPNQNYF
jgi:hypothetical protein